MDPRAPQGGHDARALTRRWTGALVALGLAMLTAGLLFSQALTAADGAPSASRVPAPRLTVNTATQCVAPTAEIRRNHPDLLVHQRDRTLRLGERGAKIELNGCIQCHATPVPGAADGARSVIGHAGAFCQECHVFAGVKLDCFECHQAKVAGRTGADGAGK